MPELQHLDGTPGYFLWFYIPQLSASLIFLVTFITLTVLHAWRMIKSKAWFCSAFVIGGICMLRSSINDSLVYCPISLTQVVEFLGYSMRAYAYTNTGLIMPYAFYAMATLLAPALFAASIYMTLGRLMRRSKTEDILVVRETWVTRLFVGSDVASFMVQGAGCGLMVMRDSKLAKIGNDIVITGLVLQIAMFGFFGITATVAHLRLRRSGDSIDTRGINVFQALCTLYAVSALIMVRSIFRLVEFIQGREGYLLRNEWPTLVFDGALMAVTMAIFYIWHPSRLLTPTVNHAIGPRLNIEK